MEEIRYENLSAEGPVEVCRELCEALMAHQTAKSRKHPEIFGGMHFENRLKPAFEGAQQRFLLVAFSATEPVGYVFCDASLVTRESLSYRPRGVREAKGEGLYPGNLQVPVICGHLTNLYVRPEFRGRGIGRTLMEAAMDWLRRVPDCRHLFVHVSEGNDAGPFYEKYGFRPSHWVCGDLIRAYRMDL